ncbi:MAG: hydantoinase B/oxoprolinase family protein [Candidatus Eremiobacteraeota bacterium]|nr:hydantoinase B/oxoprolinase family protein [Candidatus Eremiobacteraeota bacterium]
MIDKITTAVIGSSLSYASEEMGIAVRNSAYSPNIKERLDHSCALFDAQARLIAQAEHIPVHLGSLPWGLQRTLAHIAHRSNLSPGQMWVVNDPYISGTHLNDVTVIRPIYFDGNLLGFSANKAHHTDVGGMVPGSMSADAADLFAEGLIVPPTLLMQDNAVLPATVELFESNSRTPSARSGDLRAQIAGNITGERRLLELASRYGAQTLEQAIDQLLDESELRMRAKLRELGEGTFEFTDYLEDQAGQPNVRLQLTLRLHDGAAHFDYTGTSPQVSYPMNAVFGVTLSGVYYALRAVTDAGIAMNEGCFRPVSVYVPEGTLLNPRRPAPVSGGNVETSTRNADLVLQTLAQAAPDRVPACSGGTMSNVMLGGTTAAGQTWAFYETNGCGMGARPTMDGIDGIQCHMTNTLNTPIEAIERYYPLRVTRYEFIPGTGGAGTYRGGDGLVRALALTEGEARCSLLADRHTVAPPGARGGCNGATGAHALLRNSQRHPIAAKTTFSLLPGDTVEVRTPGGGGFGHT